MIHSLAERHLLPVSTLATGLTRIGRIDLEQLVASLFRFAHQLGKEHAPCRVTDRFRQTMIMNHPIDGQIFYTDHAKLIDNLSAVLVSEVLPSPRDPLMDTSNHLAMFAPLWCAFGKLTVLALDFGKRLFLNTEKTRIFNLLSIRERGKGLQANVNTYGAGVLREPFRFHFTGEAGIPFARAALADGTRFGSSLEVTMQDHLDFAYLGHHEFAVFDLATARNLGEGQGVVSPMSFKTRIAGIFTSLATPEKGFHRQIDPHRDVLQNLGMDALVSGSDRY